MDRRRMSRKLVVEFTVEETILKELYGKSTGREVLNGGTRI